MIGRLILAGSVLLVGLAVLPAVNSFLKDVTEQMIEPISTDFEIAYWQMVPIVLFLYFVFILPLWYLLGGLRRRKDRDDDL